MHASKTNGRELAIENFMNGDRRYGHHLLGRHEPLCGGHADVVKCIALCQNRAGDTVEVSTVMSGALVVRAVCKLANEAKRS